MQRHYKNTNNAYVSFKYSLQSFTCLSLRRSLLFGFLLLFPLLLGLVSSAGRVLGVLLILRYLSRQSGHVLATVVHVVERSGPL